jgi:hypothetical protein
LRFLYWKFAAFLLILYGAAAAIILAEVLGRHFGFSRTNWLALATVVASLTVFTLTAWLNVYSARLQHTMGVLLQSRLSPAYQQRMRDVVKVYPTMPTIIPVVVGDWEDPAKHEALEGIKYLLNFFEFVAIGIRNGDLDEATLRMSLSNIIFALTSSGEAFIRYSRGELGAPGDAQPNRNYEHLLWLRDRWRKKLLSAKT